MVSSAQDLDSLLFIFSHFVAGIQIAAGVVMACKFGSPWRWKLCRLKEIVVSFVGVCAGRFGADDTNERLAWNQAKQQHDKRLRAIATTMAHIILVGLLVCLWSLHISEEVDRDLLFRACRLSVVTLACLICSFYPGLALLGGVLVHALWISTFIMETNVEAAVKFATELRIWRAIILCCMWNPCICCLCSFATTSVEFYVVLPELLKNFTAPWDFVGQELLSCLAMVTLSIWLQRSMVTNRILALEAKECSQSEAAVRNILAAVCDAHVSLGSDLKIAKLAPRLSDILSIGELLGTSFLALVDADDKQRFEAFIQRYSRLNVVAQLEIAQSLHLRLTGSAGAVNVQLFHTAIFEASELVGHSIGITKIVQLKNANREPAASELEQDAYFWGGNNTQSVSIGIEEDSFATLSSQSIRPAVAAGEAAVTINIENMHVVEFTPSFASLMVSTLLKTSLPEIVDDGRHAPFATWLQEAANDIYHREANAFEYSGRVQFRIPGMKHQMTCVAGCLLELHDPLRNELAAESLGTSTHSEDVQRVRLVLQNPELVPRQQAKRRGLDRSFASQPKCDRVSPGENSVRVDVLPL
eukprot:TRINITY_DN39475_c0_g1_i1.p1 TRINITY_DN39475_c0_g1~~TRINITY_DN39475_c0_g1_i1.p1  ORF type:complete len:597 (-),score=101.39 TRINITY_DN39475_c0_g1_i1:47-1804(-)